MIIINRTLTVFFVDISSSRDILTQHLIVPFNLFPSCVSLCAGNAIPALISPRLDLSRESQLTPKISVYSTMQQRENDFILGGARIFFRFHISIAFT